MPVMNAANNVPIFSLSLWRTVFVLWGTCPITSTKRCRGLKSTRTRRRCKPPAQRDRKGRRKMMPAASEARRPKVRKRRRDENVQNLIWLLNQTPTFLSKCWAQANLHSCPENMDAWIVQFSFQSKRKAVWFGLISSVHTYFLSYATVLYHWRWCSVSIKDLECLWKRCKCV